MNNGTAPFEFVRGQRIAQLILERIFVLPVEEVEALDDTQRGAKGFGSTGKMAKEGRLENAADCSKTIVKS